MYVCLFVVGSETTDSLVVYLNLSECLFGVGSETTDSLVVYLNLSECLN